MRRDKEQWLEDLRYEAEQRSADEQQVVQQCTSRLVHGSSVCSPPSPSGQGSGPYGTGQTYGGGY